MAGRFMQWTNKQHELLDLVDLRPGGQVLEVGYGPGALIRLLLDRFPAAQVYGVDPSPDMHAMASRHNRGAITGRRLTLRVGTADETGFPDESFDQVISVNNVALWPDLQAGLRELHRVLRPGGSALIAWHSRTAPSPVARRIGLPENILNRLRAGLEEQFCEVTRHELTHLVAFSALRRSSEGHRTPWSRYLMLVEGRLETSPATSPTGADNRDISIFPQSLVSAPE